MQEASVLRQLSSFLQDFCHCLGCSVNYLSDYLEGELSLAVPNFLSPWPFTCYLGQTINTFVEQGMVLFPPPPSLNDPPA